MRRCLALDLVDDAELIALYKDYHAPGRAWPSITKSIRESGILDMEIYVFGPRMFMIMETAPDYDPSVKNQTDAEDPEVAKWEELMWTFQQSIPGTPEGEKWVEMERIFKLGA